MNPQNKNTVFAHGLLIRAVRDERTTVTVYRKVVVQLPFLPFLVLVLNDEAISEKRKKKNQVFLHVSGTVALT